MAWDAPTTDQPAEPEGFAFLEHYPHPYKVSEHAASYSGWLGVVVAHIPNGRGYDLFVPTEAAEDAMFRLRTVGDEAEADYQNDLAAAEFDRRYPPNGAESWSDEQDEIDSELNADQEGWARSQEDGWYYADD